MASLNKSEIIGRLGKDPELRHTTSGSATLTMNVATDEGYTDKQTGNKVEQTEWHRIVVWNKLAELCAQYLHKGSQIYAEGRLKTRKWQDQAGMDRYATEINAMRVLFLDSKNSNQTQQSQPAPQQGQPTQQNQPNQQQSSPQYGQPMNNQPAYPNDVPF